MNRKLFLIILFVISAWVPAYPANIPGEATAIGELEPINKTDRILIFAPHPDDETIGCAGIIQGAVSKGADVKVAYLTNGDHNQIAFIVYEKRLTLRQSEFIHMGEVRRNEAIAAMKLLGVDKRNLVFLGYPDFGTFAIFRDYWRDKKPFKSVLTRVSSVPYKENLSFGAAYKGESILADMENVIREYKPTKIFVSHPADVNSDHKALYLFLQVALQDLRRRIPEPRVYPYLIHCVGWPLPRRYHPQLNLEPPRKFLDSQIEWIKFELAPQQIDKKYQATLCYKSQTESSAFYLLSFVRHNELFGDYPEIELKRKGYWRDKLEPYLGLSNLSSSLGLSPMAYAGKMPKDKGQVTYSLLDEQLLIHIDKAKEVNRRFSTQLYLFGYSDKIPFALMPKIRIITRYKNVKVFLERKMINPSPVELELNPSEALVKIPLKFLGEPDFILSSVKTYPQVKSEDTSGFRRISIK